MGWFSKDDGTPPAPEKRKVPEWAESIQNPLDGWIVTQVFVDEENRKKRIYFAAEKVGGDSWKIYKYSYQPSRPEARLSGFRTSVHCSDAKSAVVLITRIEKMLIEEGYAPVAELKGNYREAANFIGGYIDDKGHYVSAGQEKPLEKEATFKRSGLKAMYDAKDANAGEKVIRTWDDFYREVVNGMPGEVSLSEQDKLHPRLPAVMRLIGNALTLMRALGGKELDAEERESLEREALSYSGADLHRHACKLSWGEEDAGYDVDGGQLHIVYDYEVARLTAMMRMGAMLYRKFMSSISVDDEELALLSRINETLGTFAQERLGLAPALAQQLPNVILQGPDPYADKPLPLEVFYNKYKDLVPPQSAAKKPGPKGPGV